MHARMRRRESSNSENMSLCDQASLSDLSAFDCMSLPLEDEEILFDVGSVSSICTWPLQPESGSDIESKFGGEIASIASDALSNMSLEDKPKKAGTAVWIQYEQEQRTPTKSDMDAAHCNCTSVDVILREAGVTNKAFIENFRWLVAFRNLNGHFKVSRKEHPKYGKWVENLRSQGCKKLHHRAALDAIDFNWNVRRDAWMTKYRQLQDYRQQYGTCAVPKRDALGPWVCQQRILRKQFDRNAEAGVVIKNEELHRERIRLLEAIDFWIPTATACDSAHPMVVVVDAVNVKACP